MAKQQQLTPENFVRLLQDATVIEALGKIMTPLIDASLEKMYGAKLREHETSIIALKETVALLRERAYDAEVRLDDLEGQARVDTLIVRGVPEVSYSSAASAAVNDGTSSSTTTTVSHVAAADAAALTTLATENAFIKFVDERLNIKMDRGDISAAYRIKAGTRDKFRPLIVKFNNMRIRDQIYRSKKQLKREKDSPLPDAFISEMLSPAATGAFYEARMLLKQQKITSVWTQNCRVFVKYGQNDKPVIVRNVNELRE
jgi:hypothetical protein